MVDKEEGADKLICFTENQFDIYLTKAAFVY
jgi:hypothetical protein